MKKLSSRTLLSRKFSLPCDKRLTLYNPRPAFPTFSLMFVSPLNFKCWTSTGYFQMPHTTKTSNMLFVFNSLMKSCHRLTKKPNSEILTWLMTSLPKMWHGRIFYGKCYVVVVWRYSTYKIVKVIKLFKKNASKDSGRFFMIILLYLYNYKPRSEPFSVSPTLLT